MSKRKTPATDLLVMPTPRRRRSSGMRIEEIPDGPKPQPSRILITPEHFQAQVVHGVKVLREPNELEEEEMKVLHRRKPKKSTSDMIRDTDTNSNFNAPSANPDVDKLENTGVIVVTDKDYLGALNIIVLHAMVDSHNVEIDHEQDMILDDRKLSIERRYKEKVVILHNLTA